VAILVRRQKRQAELKDLPLRPEAISKVFAVKLTTPAGAGVVGAIEI
jgi:hypothetical protein